MEKYYYAINNWFSTMWDKYIIICILAVAVITVLCALKFMEIPRIIVCVGTLFMMLCSVVEIQKGWILIYALLTLLFSVPGAVVSSREHKKKMKQFTEASMKNVKHANID